MEGVRRMRYEVLVPLIASMVALGATPARAQGSEGGTCVPMPLPAGLDDVDQLVDTAATVGSPERDDADLKMVRALRYEPARFEGIPIAGTYDFHMK